jgi:hypothetical protein
MMSTGISPIGNISQSISGEALNSFESSSLQFDLEQSLSILDLDRLINGSNDRADQGQDVAEKITDQLFEKYGSDPKMRDTITEILQPYLNGDTNNSTTKLANAWFSKLEDKNVSSVVNTFSSITNLIFA